MSCKINGCDRPIKARGYCGTCYHRLRRHGKLPLLDKRRRDQPCMICGERGLELTRRRCINCYMYLRRTGQERPRIRWGFVPCKNCRQARARVKGRCLPCYKYRWKHGQERPRWCWAENCTNCQRPPHGRPTSNGMCNACYLYHRSHGRPRPRHLIERQAPHGWCDCGEPAASEIDIRFGRGAVLRRGTLRLCESCQEIEGVVA